MVGAEIEGVCAVLDFIKLMFLYDKMWRLNFSPLFCFFRLRLCGVNLRTPFTGAAEAVLVGRKDGLTDWKDGWTHRRDGGHSEV